MWLWSVNHCEGVKMIPNSKEWKKVLIDEMGFKHITTVSEIPNEALWINPNTKVTKNINRGQPIELYEGRFNKIFFKYMEYFKVVYGVISEIHGIHMCYENLKPYDKHPSELTIANKQLLGEMITYKAKTIGFKSIILYYPSPIFARPYFEILSYVDMPIYYLSKIKILDKLSPEEMGKKLKWAHRNKNANGLQRIRRIQGHHLLPKHLFPELVDDDNNYCPLFKGIHRQLHKKFTVQELAIDPINPLLYTLHKMNAKIFNYIEDLNIIGRENFRERNIAYAFPGFMEMIS